MFTDTPDFYESESEYYDQESEHYQPEPEYQESKYLELLEHVYKFGEERKTRNATCLSLFAEKLQFDLSNNHYPLLTTKKMSFKSILCELLWFISGDTNSLHLSDQKVYIWRGNSTREFLDSRGLTNNPVGDCGPIYGFQWRHFGAVYKGADHDYTGQGFDQLQNCINLIRNDPTSRRIFMSAWNVSDLDSMCLPPCHISYQFYVNIKENTLDCLLTQRSGDLFLGIPFNIASTSLLVMMISHITGLKPGKVTIMIGDCHIYGEHIGVVEQQLERVPENNFPSVKINDREDLKEIDDFRFTDFELCNYVSQSILKTKMIA